MAWASCYTPEFRVVSIVGAAAGTTAANDRRLVEASTGTPTFVVDAIDPGRYALRMDHTTVAASISLATMLAAPQYCGVMCRFRINSGLGNSCGIVRVTASTSAESILVRVQTTGAIGYSMNGGTSFTATSTILNTGQVYRLEAFVDFGVSTTHTLKIRLDGVEIVNTTGGAATSTASAALFGVISTTPVVMDYADMVVYNDPAQYATMGNWRVLGLEPVSDGAHSMTANDFQDDAAANLSNATTTSWSKVDDAPSAAPTVTDFVQQVVTNAASYMEWVLNTTIPSTVETPVLVCLAAAMHPVASALANTAAFRLNSGGNVSAEAAIDTSVASNTLEYRKHHYTTEPGGAAWTVAKVQALRARFGYSSDASPPPALDAVMAFVVVPINKSLVSSPLSTPRRHQLTR